MRKLGAFVCTVVLSLPLTTDAAPVVTDVSWLKSRADRQIRLGDPIWVRVSNVAELRTIEAAANKPITLWIDGRDTGLRAEAFNVASRWIRFRLGRTEANREIWSDLLYDPFGASTRDLNVSVGTGKAIEAGRGANTRLTLVKVVPSHTAGWLLLLLALIVIFGWLAKRTDMLRNGPHYDDGTQQPYSLGRTQMAWWFILVLAGFVAIALVSGDGGSITPSLLALMGISAGTALGAAAIDAKPDTPKRDDVLVAVATAAAALAASPNDTNLKADLSALQRRLGAFHSENWLYDILKDEGGGVALHRFQIVIWTIVLGVMFLATVSTKLTMPEFSGTLLALMGISGGTYLGFKIPGSTQSGG